MWYNCATCYLVMLFIFCWHDRIKWEDHILANMVVTMTVNNQKNDNNIYAIHGYSACATFTNMYKIRNFLAYLSIDSYSIKSDSYVFLFSLWITNKIFKYTSQHAFKLPINENKGNKAGISCIIHCKCSNIDTLSTDINKRHSSIVIFALCLM